MSVLRLEGVSKTFGVDQTAVRAVDDVSLEVSAGEIVLIQGPSGSGKTTLLAMAGGLMRPTSGRVHLDDIELTAMTERDLPQVRLRRIGFIFQAANLLANLTAAENVEIVMEAAGTRKGAARQQSRDLLGRLGLAGRADALPEKLSGGERQRVAIARALANDAPLLLADEPTANLDSRAGYQLMHTLERLTEDEGRTVVAVTHDHRIEDVADRTLWLEDGHLIDHRPETGVTVTDPVCGMRIDPDRAAGERRSVDRSVFFCSQVCLERFDAEPARYAPTAGDAQR
ncbi:ATP-binding cassette domain-containing protein [Nocardia farcinica]|uniref:ATP-binding cassette domain-containing protein n=1 Tax=Nocardia farcinica TaxID=37329 RepID=UPI0018963B04|nr:ATP-binding cassette domain-containing protein [Nocardia farcinica]MBF6422828.1 ATP-binding cassette domain-containing protein [Nocardia farcinica]MBF6434545.1 ATP-binding cassette domain-containing protein [Nocardia farcinica]MBF6505647.1 ATP-binding cassette domain-containing protein [Nocardia farcinica]